MELFVAGGCGEHGRNCFFVDCGDVRFLVDCGLMAGVPGDEYPHLSKEQIASLDYVFLTHSHADHTGALPWLFAQGYHGPLIATRETLEQCGLNPQSPGNRDLSSLCPDGSGSIPSMGIAWGRSGHCEGSVWYRFAIGVKSILFSGDYTEDTCLYRCDMLRGQDADLAVLDCAYGNDTTSYAEYCNALVEKATAKLAKHKLLLLPVPKFGRGPELLQLLSSHLQRVPFYGDSIFMDNLRTMQKKPFWFQAEQLPVSKAKPYAGQTSGIVFISDPQLRTASARKAAQDILAHGGYAIATGTVDNGSYSSELIAAGQMDICRYPVHLNRTGYEQLNSTNHFSQTIPYHSAEIKVCSPIVF